MRWYSLRLNDGSDEPWGLVALAAALVFAPWRSWRDPLPARRLVWLCGILAIYIVAYPWMPPLVRALVLVTTLGLAAADRGFPAAWWGLLVLSLPVVATLQFYLGYPLRLLTTQLCVPLIALAGQTARAAGTTLYWAGERVVIDAPCSGLRMLWTGLFFAACLACWHRLDARRAFTLMRLASLALFLTNVLRATLLFFFETGLWSAPAGSHEGAGLLCFSLAAGVVLWIGDRLANTMPPASAVA
jgi:exosortase/archaeosortase family protein